MAWVVNQIWIGNNPPTEKLEATEKQAKAFGWNYRFWNWKDLTSTFGAFYFFNFLLDRLNEHALTFLSKFYMWHVLSICKDGGIYLDATKSFPFDEAYGKYTFSRPGVYTSPDYTPWFVACNLPEAVELAKAQVLHELEIRYKANGDRMFKFFLSSNYNMIGQRYFQNTLIPIWKSHQIEIFNNINPFKVTSMYSEVPDYLLPSVAYGKAKPALITAKAQKIIQAGENNKIAPVITVAPKDTKRIMVIGEEVMGITDIDINSQYRDLFIHVDTCPLFDHVMGKVNVQHSVYYTDPSLVPKPVRDKKDDLVDYTLLIPPHSFSGYNWMSNVVSPVSPRVALACSYKELNSKVPVLLYGHNLGDDAAKGYDVELEEVLLKQTEVEVVPPMYPVLFLILSRKKHVKQRILLSKSWVKEIPEIRCAYRFCYAAKERSKEKYTWPLLHAGNDEDDADIGKKLYAAMINACRITFNYLFIIPDDGDINPKKLLEGIDKEHPVTFGKRSYEEYEDVLTYDLSSGIGLNKEAVEKILSMLTQEKVDQMSARPDLMLAHAIKACSLATMDTSALASS